MLFISKRTTVRPDGNNKESPMSAPTTQTVAPGTWQIDKVHSHVGFAVKHMVVATFRGHFDEYDGSLTTAADGAPELKGAVKVDSLVVKDENLAGHLKSPDFFDSANYPEITFSSTNVEVSESGGLEVEGELTIKGNTHRVTARGSLTGPHTDIAGNDKLGAELEAVIDRREFGLNWNAELPKGGFALENDVRLEVSLELVREA
jgi:polyisoprenoid-binding protein YceI